MKDIWLVKYQDLIKTLTINDLKIKYQHTYLGLIWSLMSPLLLLLVLYFIFNNLRQLESNFAQYLLIGILVWRFFTASTSSSLLVIKNNSGLISNTVIPSEIFVFTKNLSALISFTLEFIILIPLVALVTGTISPYAIFFPVIHILFLSVAFGLSLILACLYPYFRDIAEIWPVLIQLGFFLCPIMYPITIIPEAFRSVYLMNPVTQVMIMYREIVLYNAMPSLVDMGYVLLFGVCIIVFGHYLFKKMETHFVEVI